MMWGHRRTLADTCRQLVSASEAQDWAVLAGQLIEVGAKAGTALGALSTRIAEGLELAARFSVLWGGADLPDPDKEDQIGQVMALMSDHRQAVEAWFTVGEWVQGLLVPMQRKDVRLALPFRERLAAALSGDPAAGLIPGERPAPAWIAAATTGEMQPSGGIRGQFNLVDASGEWIWNEGRPSDIPFADGRRVVVLDPPPYPRSWNAGRIYPLMEPTMTVDRLLSPQEAAHHLARVAPDQRTQ